MFGLIENAEVQDVGCDKGTATTGTQRHAMTQRPAHGVRDTKAGEQLTTILFDMMKIALYVERARGDDGDSRGDGGPALLGRRGE